MFGLFFRFLRLALIRGIVRRRILQFEKYMKYAIGIDIGGTNTKLGTVSDSGRVITRNTFNTTDYDSFDTYIEHLIEEISALIKKSGEECKGIGIGAPNGNYYKGTIDMAANLPFGLEAPIVDRLRNAFGYKHIYLTNDANAAALGEKIYGGGKTYDHFITITLGTGLGAGIIVDGKLLYGADGNAGELGHVCAVEGGRICGCGNKGCLEAYASATGIKRTFFEMLAYYNGKTSLSGYSWETINPKIIEDAAKAGDEVSKATYDFTGRILGRALADFVHFSRPSVFFLFGGPVKSGELIFAPTRKSMEEHLMPVFRGKVKVLPSELPEADAAILGSSALVWSGIANEA